MTPESVRRVTEESVQIFEKWNILAERLDTQWARGEELYGGKVLAHECMKKRIERYTETFRKNHIPAERMSIDKTPPARADWFPHAHYLSRNIKNIFSSGEWDKANRHMSAICMCFLADRIAPYVTREQWIAHGYHVAKELLDFVDDSAQWEKTNRYFAAMQMSLLAAGWATIRELMEYNKAGTIMILRQLDS